MISASTILLIKFVTAVGGFVLLCAKAIDWRRHKNVPAALKSHAYRGTDGTVFTAERPAPCFAGRKYEKVAKFDEIAPLIKTGDVLTFSGRTIWSYILRIATYSDKSHAGIVVRDEDGLWVVDSCEGRNVTKRSLFDEVRNYPGQWYIGQIRKEFLHNYHRQRVADAALAMVGTTKYGWIGIVFQAFIRLPVLREIAYATKLDRLPFYKRRPFCSQAVKDWMKLGSLDPVPGRDGQLVVPQDINQSLAVREWIALVP